MNNEAQRIAIATACGWKRKYPAPHYNDFVWIAPWGEMVGQSLMPMYATDLNACHEMFKTFTYEQAEQFYKELFKIVEFDEFALDNPRPGGFALVNATAAQRAEAFLKCFNLWEEDK